MSHREFLSWTEFYRAHPFDDMHRYQRPAALISASMSGNYAERLAFLAPDPKDADLNQADLNTLRAFGLRK
jgi:hypothetical protein